MEALKCLSIYEGTIKRQHIYIMDYHCAIKKMYEICKEMNRAKSNYFECHNPNRERQTS